MCQSKEMVAHLVKASYAEMDLYTPKVYRSFFRG